MAGLPSITISSLAPPINWVNSSLVTLVSNWPGETAVSTFMPMALVLISSVTSLATL